MNFVLDLRSANTGGAVVPARLTEGRLEDLQFAAQVTFLLHGFNVNRPEGHDSLLGFANLLPASAARATVAVLWPGDSRLGALSYSFEKRDAEDSAAELVKFIRDNLRGHPRLSFVAHSLGSRVTLHTVRALAGQGFALDQVCLMAAAVDDDSLAASAVYRKAADAAARVAVLHSRSDTVLRHAYPMGDWLQSFVYWGEVSGAALGLRGPRAHAPSAEGVPKNVRACEIAKSRRARHSDYLPDQVQASPQNQSANRLSAAAFAAAVLAGEPEPGYP